MLRPLSFLIMLFCLSSFSRAADSTSTETVYDPKFEFSFGQSLLFLTSSQEIDLLEKEAVVLPTSALLIFIEGRPYKKLRVPFFFNLPTESKQFIVNGVIVNERVNPSFGIGIEFQIFKVGLGKNSTIEWEMGPLLNFLLTRSGKVLSAPVAAGRVRIIKKRDFVMYIGPSYSFGIDSWGLIYGTGFLF